MSNNVRQRKSILKYKQIPSSKSCAEAFIEKVVRNACDHPLGAIKCYDEERNLIAIIDPVTRKRTDLTK